MSARCRHEHRRQSIHLPNRDYCEDCDKVLERKEDADAG